MKIILTSEDIKKLIENTYEGVEEVKLKNDLEIEIKVSESSLKTKIPNSPNKHSTIPNKIITPKIESPPISGEPVGVMQSGGERDRYLPKF